MISILDPYRDISLLSIVIKLALTTFLSGIIGFERGYRGRAAGLRTHILVALGAATIMMINEYTFTYINPNSDPTRLGAQVISGIGFLGAGTIMVTGNNKVSGLTTAAGLWVSACIGLAAGIGFYELSVIATSFLFFVMTTMSSFEKKIKGYTSRVSLLIELVSTERLTDLVRELNASKTAIQSLIILDGDENDTPSGNVKISLTISLGHRQSLAAFMDHLMQKVDIVSIKEARY